MNRIAIRLAGGVPAPKKTLLPESEESMCPEQAWVISNAGKAYCWGTEYYGQLGDGESAAVVDAGRCVYQRGAAGQDPRRHRGRRLAVCAVDTDGRTYCWGHNLYGAVGDGTTQQRNVPVAIDRSGALNGETITSVEAGNWRGWGRRCVRP